MFILELCHAQKRFMRISSQWSFSHHWHKVGISISELLCVSSWIIVHIKNLLSLIYEKSIYSIFNRKEMFMLFYGKQLMHCSWNIKGLTSLFLLFNISSLLPHLHLFPRAAYSSAFILNFYLANLKIKN